MNYTAKFKAIASFFVFTALKINGIILLAFISILVFFYKEYKL